MKALMLAAMQSGSGKTAVTCALLAAARRRGLEVHPFKTGPDYIDPMFHTKAAGRPSRNLDRFLQGEAGVRRTLATAGATAGEGLALIEGAMGYYDGMAGGTDAGAWAVADALGIPAVLVLRPEGQGVTLAAQLYGMLRFRSPSHIAGVLFSGCKASLADYLPRLPPRFVQCHKSFCVNLDYVAALETSRLILDRDEPIPISQARRAATRQRFLDYALPPG